MEPTGIVNLNNSCYINAAIQCLLACNLPHTLKDYLTAGLQNHDNRQADALQDAFLPICDILGINDFNLLEQTCFYCPCILRMEYCAKVLDEVKFINGYNHAYYGDAINDLTHNRGFNESKFQCPNLDCPSVMEKTKNMLCSKYKIRSFPEFIVLTDYPFIIFNGSNGDKYELIAGMYHVQSQIVDNKPTRVFTTASLKFGETIDLTKFRNNGHYIAYVKYGNLIYECDDEKITLVKRFPNGLTYGVFKKIQA